MSNVNAVKLIIENIQLLEQAKQFIEGETSEKFLVAVDTKIQEKIKEFGWIGIFNFYETNNLWFLPKNWKEDSLSIEESKKFEGLYAYYELWSRQEGEVSNEWWLTSFLPNDNEKMVLNFEIDFTKFKVKPSKKERLFFTLNANNLYPDIEKNGFKYDGENGHWYLSIVSLDTQEIIKNYESDTLEDALAPIIEALDKLKQTHSYFDEIIQSAIAKFGRVEVEEIV